MHIAHPCIPAVKLGGVPTCHINLGPHKSNPPPIIPVITRCNVIVIMIITIYLSSSLHFLHSSLLSPSIDIEDSKDKEKLRDCPNLRPILVQTTHFTYTFSSYIMLNAKLEITRLSQNKNCSCQKYKAEEKTPQRHSPPLTPIQPPMPITFVKAKQDSSPKCYITSPTLPPSSANVL